MIDGALSDAELFQAGKELLRAEHRATGLA
jgi:hypothetical protein